MKKIYSFCAVVAFAFSGINNCFAQCLMLDAPLADRIQASPFIFEGKVIEKSSFWNAAHTSIFTTNTVEVYKVFKGTITTAQVEVITPGGVVEDKMELVHPALDLNLEETGVFILKQSDVVNPTASPNKSGLQLESYYASQGFIKYDLVEHTASDVFRVYTNIPNEVYAPIVYYAGQNYRDVKTFDIKNTGYHVAAKNSAMAPVITSFSPTTITSGTLSTLTINGSGFGTNTGSAKVEFKNADDGGASYWSVSSTVLPANIVSWSATSIQVMVPSKCGTGTIRVTDNAGAAVTSSSSLTMTYGQITAVSSNIEYRLKLANKNTAGGYDFKYCSTFNANTAAAAAFTRALSTWRCATMVNFQQPGTTADACNGTDGISIVNFDGGCVLGGNLLGITNSYFNGCQSGGTWYWTDTEMDIRFAASAAGGVWNFGPAATTGGKYDFESTALHELGHAHGLAHVIDPPALLHWSRNANTDVRTLSAGSDIAGGNEVLSRSITGNPCGTTAHVKLTSNCALGVHENTAIENNISIYPNPVSTTATIQVDPSLSGSTMSFSLFDVLGNEVKTASFNSQEYIFNRGTLPNGLYLYQVKNGSAVIGTGKLILYGK